MMSPDDRFLDEYEMMTNVIYEIPRTLARNTALLRKTATAPK